jgi:hypothetical protein
MIRQILTKSLLAAVVFTLASTTMKSSAQTASAGLTHHLQPKGDPSPAPDPTGDGN